MEATWAAGYKNVKKIFHLLYLYEYNQQVQSVSLQMLTFQLKKNHAKYEMLCKYFRFNHLNLWMAVDKNKDFTNLL